MTDELEGEFTIEEQLKLQELKEIHSDWLYSEKAMKLRESLFNDLRNGDPRNIISHHETGSLLRSRAKLSKGNVKAEIEVEFKVEGAGDEVKPYELHLEYHMIDTSTGQPEETQIIVFISNDGGLIVNHSETTGSVRTEQMFSSDKIRESGIRQDKAISMATSIADSFRDARANEIPQDL